MTTAHRRLGTVIARVLGALLLLGSAGLGAAACGTDERAPTTSSSVGRAGSTPVDVKTFAAAVAKPGTTLLDVRTPAEFAAGHLAGAVNIDVQGADFADLVGRLDPDGHYAVYCHSGNRSARAVAYLVDHGFGDVVELAGGIVAWQAAGRPVTTS